MTKLRKPITGSTTAKAEDILRSSLFWGNLTQRLSVVTSVSPMFKGQARILKMRPICCPETSVTNYRPICVTSQKSEELIYVAAEA